MLSNRRHNLILGWAADGGRRGRESEREQASENERGDEIRDQGGEIESAADEHMHQ